MTSLNILVVAAHPDDEILGVGGTSAWHVSKGDIVEVLILAEGATSRTKTRDVEKAEKELSSLRACATKAAEILGTQPPHFGGLADNRMDGYDLLDVVKQVESLVDQLKPDIIYTHHGSDLNIDHRITFEAVLTACRPQPGFKAPSIYTFETVSSTEWGNPIIGTTFTPQRYVDISNTLDQKMAALKAYSQEMRDFPHARSCGAVEALAAQRGCQVGRTAAEGFMLVRDISKP